MMMSWIDWLIVLGLLVVLTVTSIRTNRYARSVSGFLAANRCAGRYLITIAYGMAQLGVISLVWFWQQNYDVGFTSIWWGFMEGPALILIALTGWVVYRFRQTRAMTMAQFFEIRYSRNFRVFAGLVAFISGIINYGIFPAVAARFFIHLCGLPEVVSFLGMEVDTFPLLMGLLLGTALVFVFLGGQIAVMVTDFIQGALGNIVFIVVILFLLYTFGWDRISVAMLESPPGQSMVDPFDLGKEENFNVWYWVISVIVLFYGMLGWQGTSGYNASALNAHEAKMANILNGWRFRVLMLIVLVLPICIRVLMNDEAYAEQAAVIQSAVDRQETAALGSEIRTPVATGDDAASGLAGPDVCRHAGCLHQHQRHLPARVGDDLRAGRDPAVPEEADFKAGPPLDPALGHPGCCDLCVLLQHALHTDAVHRDVPGDHRGDLRRRSWVSHHRGPVLEAGDDCGRLDRHARGYNAQRVWHHREAVAVSHVLVRFRHRDL